VRLRRDVTDPGSVDCETLASLSLSLKPRPVCTVLVSRSHDDCMFVLLSDANFDRRLIALSVLTGGFDHRTSGCRVSTLSQL